MVRLVQRKLIIPRGDTGSFTIPALINAAQDDVLVFSILDPIKHTKVFEKTVQAENGIITIAFTHSDTVNLMPGKYVWDIKYYAEPVYADGKLIDGVEIDSYYAAFGLPVCEIRGTGDNLLMSDDAPTATLSPAAINLVTAALATVREYLEQIEQNMAKYVKHEELQPLTNEEIDEITGGI